MNNSRFSTYLPALLMFGFGLYAALEPRSRAFAQSDPVKVSDVAMLQAEIQHLKSLVPDQSHAMTDVEYHFTNLWFAAQNQNWPLAKFYLDETRSHLNWAVRIKPVRKTAAGQEVDLKSILQALEQSCLKDLNKAVGEKNVVAVEAAYRQTLEGCYSCHMASEKPYLHPQVPETPATRIIRLAPDTHAQLQQP